jgi:hypothetical protein
VIQKVIILLAFFTLGNSLYVSASPNERWGCIDSSGSGDIYFLDIFGDRITYDFRDKNMTPVEYELLNSPSNEMLIARIPITITPAGDENPETCSSCAYVYTLMFDRKEKLLMRASLTIGKGYQTKKLDALALKTVTQCDRLM